MTKCTNCNGKGIEPNQRAEAYKEGIRYAIDLLAEKTGPKDKIFGKADAKFIQLLRTIKNREQELEEKIRE